MARYEILSDDGLRQKRDTHFRRLSQLFRGRPGQHVFVLCGVKGQDQNDLYTKPENWMIGALDDLASRTEVLCDSAVFRPLSVNPWLYGVHFVDTLFGAQVYELDGEKDNWQVTLLPSSVGHLDDPKIDTHPSFHLAQRLAAAFVNAGVSVPLFAPPVLSSPLNIALNLYGPEFLVAILDQPEAARHDLRVITDPIKALHAWFQEHIPFEQLQMIETRGRIQPPGHGQICGCSTQLLSPEQYRETFAPYDEEILNLYPGGGMIHLCGSHSQHIPTWREMAALRTVQLNDRATEDTALFYSGLRQDQILYVYPCAAMPVSGIMEITGGERTVIVGDYTEVMSA